MKNTTIYLSILLAFCSTNVLAQAKDIPPQSQNDRDSTNRAEMLTIKLGSQNNGNGATGSENVVPGISVRTKPGTCPAEFPIGGQVWASIDNGVNWVLVDNTCHIINREMRERECNEGQAGKIITKRETKDFQDGSKSDVVLDWELVSDTCGIGVPEEPTGVCEGKTPPRAQMDYVILPVKPGEYYGRICYLGPTPKYTQRFAERMSGEPTDQHVARNQLVAGQIGGQVESYSNLYESNSTTAISGGFTGWVAEQAKVGGTTKLYQNAQIYNNAVVINSQVNTITDVYPTKSYIYGNADIRNTNINTANKADADNERITTVRVFGNVRSDTTEGETVLASITGGSVLSGNVVISAGDSGSAAGRYVMTTQIDNSNISGNVKITGYSQIKDSYLSDYVLIGERGEYFYPQSILIDNSTISDRVEIEGRVSVKNSIVKNDAKLKGADNPAVGVVYSTAINDSIISDDSIIGSRTFAKKQPTIENSKVNGSSIIVGEFNVQNSEIQNSYLAPYIDGGSAAGSRVYNNSKVSNSSLIKVLISNSIVNNYKVPGTGSQKTIYSKIVDGDTGVETTNPPPATP